MGEGGGVKRWLGKLCAHQRLQRGWPQLKWEVLGVVFLVSPLSGNLVGLKNEILSLDEVTGGWPAARLGSHAALAVPAREPITSSGTPHTISAALGAPLAARLGSALL